jgi:hypothetical protein
VHLASLGYNCEAGCCKIKQEFLNKWCEVPLVKDEMVALFKAWNEARNKDGDTWKGLKRTSGAVANADDAKVSEASEENAVPHKPTDDEPRTLAEASLKHGPPVIVPHKDGVFDHVFYPNTGAYALNVKTDGTVTDTDFLVLVKGKFESSDNVQELKDKGGPSLVKWDGIQSVNEEYSFSHDIKVQTDMHIDEHLVRLYCKVS